MGISTTGRRASSVLLVVVCTILLVRNLDEASAFSTRSLQGPRTAICSDGIAPSKLVFSQGTRYRKYDKEYLQSTFVSLRAKKSDDNNSLETTANESDTSPITWIFGLVVPLWLVYISNQWSRSSLYYLVDFSKDADPTRAMNLDVGFTEAQYGILASLAFTSLFAVASLAAGIISDRFNRKTLTVSAALVWSIATLGTSFSDSYPEVLGWRVAMGLACAFVTPPAYTLIAERVPKDRVSLASSLYGTGVALGGAFASLSILLDNNLGWRGALQVIGVYGFSAAVIAALVLPNDPKDNNDNGEKETDSSALDLIEQPSSILDDVQEAVSTDRIKWLFLGSFLRFSSGLCIGVWSASYFRMVFPDNQAEYAVAQAVITAVAGSTSGLLGGYLADSISKKAEKDNNGAGDSVDVVGRRLWIPVVGSILAAPTWYFAIESNRSFEVAMAWLAAEYFVAECWFGPTISVLQKTVGPRIGGTSQGLFTLTGSYYLQ